MYQIKIHGVGKHKYLVEMCDQLFTVRGDDEGMAIDNIFYAWIMRRYEHFNITTDPRRIKITKQEEN